jgi:hypothetical protein
MSSFISDLFLLLFTGGMVLQFNRSAQTEGNAEVGNLSVKLDSWE